VKNSFGVGPRASLVLSAHCSNGLLKSYSWRYGKASPTALQIWRAVPHGEDQQPEAIFSYLSPEQWLQNAGPDSTRIFCPLPPIGAKDLNLRSGLQGIVQQSLGLQFQQTLALLDVVFASRQVLGMPCIHQIDLDAAFFQTVLERDPIHLSRLQAHGFHSAAF
jgi:hypothetical protein